jgi:hypothetical protein
MNNTTPKDITTAGSEQIAIWFLMPEKLPEHSKSIKEISSFQLKSIHWSSRLKTAIDLKIYLEEECP